MLNKVKTLLLDGCGSSRLLDSKLNANSNDKKLKASSSAIVEAILLYLKPFMISVPRSLVRLSLDYNNSSTECFPTDFSYLSMLKHLSLDGNPIISIPDCVRSLLGLETLTMRQCNMLMSVEHPPPTLRELRMFDDNDTRSLRKVVFDLEMSPLELSTCQDMLSPLSFEFEGMIKIQPMAGVEKKVLRSLGWTELDFLKEMRLRAGTLFGRTEESEIQMYYEFRMFSTIYGGQEMPNWITDRSKGTSISFIIPSSSKQLRGLNFCYMQMRWGVEFRNLPVITVSNITKNRIWIYRHYIRKVNVGGESVIMLSHWMFGMNEMEDGDHVTITVKPNSGLIKECGVSFVYDDGEEEVLGYYKSWNHIIGRDLSPFQPTTGEYLLNNVRFLLPRVDNKLLRLYWHVIGEVARYKDDIMQFKALSQRKSGVHLLEDDS